MPHSQSNISRRMTLVVGGFILLAFALHAVVLIRNSSFVIDGTRYYCLFDDAMISMTYARNWADGAGLVWNVGETPVEGYSNFAWVAVMAVVHLVGLAGSDACLAMHGICILIACANIVFGGILARNLGFSRPSALLAMLLIATCYQLSFLTLFGMETGAAALLTTLAVMTTLTGFRQQRASYKPFVFIGLMMLVRTDAVVVLFATAGFLIIKLPGQRWRVVSGCAIALAPAFLQIAWRLSYYGEWFPNTYYLKLTGWPLHDRLARGVYECLKSFFRISPFVCVLVFAYVRRREKELQLLTALLGGFLAYQVWVGGDVWPLDRFICPVIPSLLAYAGGGLMDRRYFIPRTESRPHTCWPCARFVFVVISIGMLNHSTWRELLILTPPRCREENRQNVTKALALREILGSEGVTGLYYAGTIPYFAPGTYIDFLGKCDHVVARTPVKVLWLDSPTMMPGHNKWLWRYTVGQRKPDIITRSEGQLLVRARRFRQNYVKCHLKSDVEGQTTFWARKRSRNVGFRKLIQVNHSK